MGGSWPAERTAIATTSRLLQQVLGQWQFRTQDKDKLVAMKPSIPLASVYSAQWTPKLVERGSPTKIKRSHTCQQGLLYSKLRESLLASDGVGAYCKGSLCSGGPWKHVEERHSFLDTVGQCV